MYAGLTEGILLMYAGLTEGILKRWAKDVLAKNSEAAIGSVL